MLSILLNKYPEIMAIIKRRLKDYVRVAEEKYNATPNSYWYRFFRPNDAGIGGTEYQYYATMTDSDEEHLLAQSSAITVPVANAYVSFGFYIDADFGKGGYVQVEKQGVTKFEIPARKIYLQDDPQHLYIDFDHVVSGFQQEKLDFIFYNEFGADQICFAFPFMFRIASKSALNLE